MANSIYKVHEMINKVGFEFDDTTAKKVAELATKAGKLAAGNMTKELGMVIGEIGDIFNKALAKMGKQQIDLTNIIKMPDGDAIGQLAESFVAQLTGGVASAFDGIEAQFNDLIKKRNQAVQELEELQNKHRIKTEEASKLDEAYNALVSNRNESGADNDELAEHTQDILSDFMAINDELLEMEENGKVNASTLKKWLVTAKELSTIYNTIQNMDPERRAKITPQIGKVNMQYFLDGQYDEDIEYGTSIVDEFIDNNDFTDHIEMAQKKVADFNAEISKLTQQHPELVSEQSAVEAEERLNRVKDAFDRLLVSRGKNKGAINEKGVQAIHAALKYNPKGSKIPAVDQSANIEKMQKAKEATDNALASLDKLGNAYVNSAGSNWETRAIHLVKFIKEYESLMNNPNVNQELIAGWTDTYGQLKPMFAESLAMLQSVHNMAEGKEPVDMSNIGAEVEAAEQERIADEASANAEAKARVEAEAKAQAEKETSEAAKQTAEAINAEAQAQEKAAARRAELVGQLDSYGGDVLTYQEADTNLQEREKILQQLRDEDLLTEEIKKNYDEINKRLRVRAQLLFDAESNYDDIDDVVTGSRIDAIDSGNQYRKDHIAPFDATISQMESSGFFAEEELEKFYAISDAMETRARDIDIEDSLDKLDELYDETDNITDASQLNNILEERKHILQDVAFESDYEDEIERQKQINAELEKRVSLLRDAQNGLIDSDDIDDILQENGTLDSKLDRLGDVAYDWGIKIKDGDEDEAIDELEAFEETYDRIVLKLANGRNIEILPNAKGLRALYKYSDGLDSSAYGETEIEDVEFVRKNMQAHQENTAAINAEMQAQEHLNQTKSKQHQIEKSEAESAEVAEENAKAEAIKQQNAALQDNIALQSQATVQGVVTATDTSTTATPAQTVPIGAISAEAAELEAVRAKVVEVTNAINAKTQAFTNEEIEVKRVVETEIASLDLLEQKATTIKNTIEGLISNIKTGSDDVGVGLSNINITVNKSGELDTESQGAWALESTLQLVKGTLDGVRTDIGNVINAISHTDTKALSTVVGDVPATENTLLAIKSVLDAISGKVQASVSNKTTPSTTTSSEDNAVVRYEPEPDSQSFGGGGNKPTEKIKTALTALLKYKTTLQEANQLSGDLEIGINNLYAELSQVSDKEELTIWNEHFKQFKNASAILRTLVKDYQALGEVQARAAMDEDQVKQMQYLDDAQIIQDRIDTKIVDVNVDDDRFEEARQRAYNLTVHELQQKQELVNVTQVEAEIVKRLIKLYEQLGHAQFLGNAKDATAIRQQIGAERANLSSVDYATDMKFRHAKEKGYNAEKTKADNAALKEQEAVIKRLNTLYQEYGVLVERASATVGTNLGAEIADQVAAKDAEIRALESPLDIITPEMSQKFGEAFDKGKAIESRKQYEAIARKSDQDEVARLNTIKGLEKEIGTLRADADAATDAGVKNALEQEIQLRQDLIELQKQGLSMDVQDEAYYKKLYSLRTKQAKTYAKENQREQAATFKDEIAKAQREAGLSKSRTTAGRAEEVLTSAMGIQGITPEQINNLEAYRNKIATLKSTINNFPKDGVASEEQKNQLVQQRIEVENYTKEIQELIAQNERLTGPNATVIGQSTLGTNASPVDVEAELTRQVQAYTNGKAYIKSYNAETQQLTYVQKTAKGAMTQFTAEINKTNGALTSVRGTTTKAMSVFEQIGKKMREYTYYFTGSMMIMRVINEIKQGINIVKEIDSALTELKKVTDATEESYDKFLDTAAKTASKVGSTIKDVVSSTADWARLGYTIQEAHQMAESTQVLMNVSEFTDVSRATDALISSIQAFKYTAEESMDVVDILNTIGNNYAISTADLATSLTKSSGSLVAANGTLEEAVALTATANTIIQDADVVGTALKTVAMRLRGTDTKTMEEEGVEVDGVVTSKSKLRGKIQSLSGVDILTDTGAYKSTYQILSEIANVWKDINDMDQAALLEILAGKRAGSVMSAILQNPETLKDAFESANEASGSALAENEKYLDSIQGRIDLFNNAVQTMWNNALNSDVVKLFVDIGTSLVKIVDKLGLVQTIVFGLLTYYSAFKKQGKLDLASVLGIHDIEKGWTFGKEGASGWVTKRLFPNKQKEIDSIEQNVDEIVDAAKEKLHREQAAFNEDANRQLSFGLDAVTDTPKAPSKYLGIFENGLPKGMEKLTYDTEQLGIELDKLNGMDNAGIVNYMESLDDLGGVGDDTKNVLAGYASTVTDGNYTLQGAKVYVDNYNKSLAQMSKEATIAQFKQNMLNLAISAFTIVLTTLITKLIESAAKSQDKFEELSSQLASTNSELESLNSELDTTKERIQELQELGSLSFVEQEELERLKAQNEELEIQKKLKEEIQKQQQKGVNNASVKAANDYYKKTGKNSGKTTGEIAGQGAQYGVMAGGAIAAAGGATALAGALASSVAAFAIPVVGPILAGLLIAGTVAAVGAGVGAAIGAHEEKVGESMDNMREQYTKLQEEYNAAQGKYTDKTSDKNYKKMQKAQEKLTEYESMMANHLAEMDAYYSQIDLSVYDPVEDADEIARLRKEMNEFYDTQDKWLIQSGSKDAKNNAITRIFGQNASKELQNIKREIQDVVTADDWDGTLNLSDYFNAADLDDFTKRLHDMGLYVYEVENYFKDMAAAEKEAADVSLYGVATDINKITESLDSLKSAFDEVLEGGSVTAKTLSELNEIFGTLGDSWDNYVNTMFSGVASTKEMQEATEALAKAFIDSKILTGEAISEYERMAYIIQLRNLGVTNAEEYVDDKIQENAYKAIQNSADYNKSELEDNFNKLSNKQKKELGIKGKDFDDLSTDELAKIAEYYNMSKEINAETAQEIADEYGIEIDNLNEVISLLEKKEKAEKKATEAKKEQNELDEWLNKENGWNQTQEKINNADDNVKNFNMDDWRAYSNQFQGKVYTTYKNQQTGETLSKEEFEDLQNKVKEYRELIARRDELIKEGQEKGWINEDGALKEGIEEEFAAAYEAAKNGVEDLEKQIETELTADVKLNLELQKKSDLVDQFQEIYDTLADAEQEYNENKGYVSVDTLQSLLQLEPKYLSMLYDENGQLNLNKETLLQVAQARTLDMGIQAAQNVITQASEALEANKIDRLRELTQVTYDQANSNWALVDSNLAVLKSTLEQRNADPTDEMYGQLGGVYEGVESQVLAIQDLTNRAVANIGNSFSSSGNTTKAAADDAFKKLMSYYENRIGAEQARFEQVQSEVDLLEKQGKKAGEGYYDEQIASEERRLKLLEQQKVEAQKYLKQFKEGSDDWWSIANTLNDIEGEIDSVTSSIQDLSDAIAEVNWYKLEEPLNRIDNVKSTLSNMRDLLAPRGEEDWFDDEGLWTDKGSAVVGAYITEIEWDKQALDQTQKTLNKLQVPYEGNEEYYKSLNLGIDSEQDLYDKRAELQKQEQTYSKNIIDNQNAIADMYESQIDAVEEWANEAIEAYNDYIDVVKEALDAERDLYDFKKNVEKQTKDISKLERRIMALSGSNNAADIATRRKLEAELYEARESLNDTYYDHAKDSQQQALEAEAAAYEEAMNKFIEGLRTSLETALQNMDGFMQGVFKAVTSNAPAIVEQYKGLDIALDGAIISPWDEAAQKVKDFGGANGLGIMNSWVTSGGPIYDFDTEATKHLKNPWTEGSKAVDSFTGSVSSAMSTIVSNIHTNVSTATGELKKLQTEMSKVNDTTVKPTVATGGGGGGDTNYEGPSKSEIESLQKVLNWMFSAGLKVDGKFGPSTTAALKNAQKVIGVKQDGKYGVATRNAMIAYIDTKIKAAKMGPHPASSMVGQGIALYEMYKKTLPNAFYAKGTLGTKKDEWAITDESWIGEEITLAAGKSGQLQYLKKGSAVMPADISANLVEWGKLNPNMLNMTHQTAGVNIISNAVNKPELNVTFDSLVHVDHCDEGTLKGLEKMVDNKINEFSKQMNYAIKKIGGR